MKIPTAFYLGGLKHVVKFVQHLSDKNFRVCLGIYFVEDSEIHLLEQSNGEKYKIQYVEKVFCHELNHAILYKMASERENDEKFIETTAVLLHQFLNQLTVLNDIPSDFKLASKTIRVSGINGLMVKGRNYEWYIDDCREQISYNTDNSYGNKKSLNSITQIVLQAVYKIILELVGENELANDIRFTKLYSEYLLQYIKTAEYGKRKK